MGSRLRVKVEILEPPEDMFVYGFFRVQIAPRTWHVIELLAYHCYPTACCHKMWWITLISQRTRYFECYFSSLSLPQFVHVWEITNLPHVLDSLIHQASLYYLWTGWKTRANIFIFRCLWIRGLLWELIGLSLIYKEPLFLWYFYEIITSPTLISQPSPLPAEPSFDPLCVTHCLCFKVTC